MDTPPFIPRDVLDYLQARYPDRCPDLHLGDRDFGAYVGARQVIRHLEGVYADQTASGDDETPVPEPVSAIYRATRRPERR